MDRIKKSPKSHKFLIWCTHYKLIIYNTIDSDNSVCLSWINSSHYILCDISYMKAEPYASVERMIRLPNKHKISNDLSKHFAIQNCFSPSRIVQKMKMLNYQNLWLPKQMNFWDNSTKLLKFTRIQSTLNSFFQTACSLQFQKTRTIGSGMNRKWSLNKKIHSRINCLKNSSNKLKKPDNSKLNPISNILPCHMCGKSTKPFFGDKRKLKKIGTKH